MTILKESSKYNLLVADDGKHIRRIEDVENPIYSTMIYIPVEMTTEEINETYIEEFIEEGYDENN